MNNQHALLTVTGRDRPGMVARTTQVLFETGCNIADSSMTRLGGEFTVMLILHLPPVLSLEALAERFRPLAAEMGLDIHVQPLSTEEALSAHANDSTQGAVISLIGADQPGIVFRVTQFLAEAECNITDLYTRQLGTTDRPIYSMVIEVESAAQSDLVPRLQAGLTRLEQALNVEISLRPSDPALM